MAGDGGHPQKSLKRKRLPLGATRAKTGKKSKKVGGKSNKPGKEESTAKSSVRVQLVQNLSSAEQLSFFLRQFQSANAIKLSSLELESIKDSCVVKLSDKPNQDASNLERHIKYAFGSSWRDVLYEGKLVEGRVGQGSPAVIIISASAIRALEMLRGLRSLTKKCQPAKLFSKHIKVEEQVTLLKERVNIASGTPSRIKKLCEIEALGLSRLQVIILDMHTDVKGYSILTLPQVRDEFWDLYKSYFHERLVQGNLRICLYGPIPKPAEPSVDNKAQ